MKKIIYKLSIALTPLIFAASCKQTLETPPKSVMEESTIFANPDLAEGAIAGVLQSFGETNSYRGRYLVFYGINNDCEVNNSLKNITDEKSLLSNYQTNVNNGQMNTDNNAWAKFYEGIERANLAIRGIRTYGDTTNAKMRQVLGEMLTLRAVLYNDLIRGWGDVPARFAPIDAATMYLPRSDRDTIYKHLLKDLEVAAGLVAWPNGNAMTGSVERINKAFVKGLRARLALAAGGFSQRANNVIRRSQDPDLAPEKMYAIAKQECLDVINSNTCKLLTFEGVFKTLCAETNKAGEESLWEIPFAEGRGRVIFDLGVKHTTVDKYTAQNKGGTNGPNPLMYYMYDREDTRRDVTCVPYEWTDGKQKPTNLGKWYFGKYRYEWLPRRVTSTNDDGLNWMYMRYADILLMAAEAINEIDGPAAAAPYLKEVRQRAFPNSPAKVADFMTQVSSSKTAFFNAIVNERALEFTGEMLRKNDLIRWNLLGTKLAEAKTKLEQLEKRQGAYADLPLNIYYNVPENGEVVTIYGLNHGDTDAQGAALSGYKSQSWTMSASSDASTYWDALYRRDPNLQQFWPIWQFFLDASNGQLTNAGFF